MIDHDDPTETIHTLFVRSVAKFGDEPALEVGGVRLTYNALAELVERRARSIVAASPVGSGAVGLLVGRNLSTYVAYLACLRAGAVVVPLHPNSPATRNAEVCRLAGVSVLVADEGDRPLADDVARRLPGTTVLTGTGTPRARSATSRQYAGAADDVAYTLFTSGSTGRPKAVPIRHRNLLRYLDHCVRRYRVGPGSRLSQTFDLTFDPSVFDMFVAWAGGATVVVPQAADVLAPVRFVNEARITHWFSVPSVIAVARRLRALRPGSMPDLRWSLFAGEQLTLDHARAWARAAPNSVVENLYGPTELTVTCAEYRLPPLDDAWPTTSNGTVPIGAVHPHLEERVVDEEGADTDDGELCVRGAQRFDGYLRREDNEGRFYRMRGDDVVGVLDPAADDWFRTGDRVRREDGGLVHLGRLDAQVKVRGFRVELGEVEAVLRMCAEVHDAVALADTSDGEVRIVAAFVGDPVDEAVLSARATDHLPPYMVPSRIVRLPAFPVNANGKIDRAKVMAEVARGPV